MRSSFDQLIKALESKRDKYSHIAQHSMKDKDKKRAAQIQAALEDLLHFARSETKDSLPILLIKHRQVFLLSEDGKYDRLTDTDGKDVPEELVAVIRQILSEGKDRSFAHVLIARIPGMLRRPNDLDAIAFQYYFIDCTNKKIIRIDSNETLGSQRSHDKLQSMLDDGGYNQIDIPQDELGQGFVLSSRDAKIAATVANVPYVNRELAQEALNTLDSVYSPMGKIGDFIKEFAELIIMVVEKLGLKKPNPAGSEVNLHFSARAVAHRFFHEIKKLDTHNIEPAKGPVAKKP